MKLNTLQFLSAQKRLLWARNLLSELGASLGISKLFVDNQGTIKLIENKSNNPSTKHLEVKLHFMKDINNIIIKVLYVNTLNNVADILTKPLDKNPFKELRHKLSLRGDHIEANCAMHHQT